MLERSNSKSIISGEHIENKREVKLKFVPNVNECCAISAINERNVLSEVHKDNNAKMFVVEKFMFYENVFDGNNNVKGCALVLECGGPNLQQLITQMRSEKRVNSRKVQSHSVKTQMYCHSMSNALNFIHSANYVWTDLKPQNLVLFTESSGESCLKAIDLDSCCAVGTPVTNCTIEYAPPEATASLTAFPPLIVTAHSSYDIWSMGVINAELLLYKYPFTIFGGGTTAEEVNESVSDVMSHIAKDGIWHNVLQSMLCMDERSRARFE